MQQPASRLCTAPSRGGIQMSTESEKEKEREAAGSEGTLTEF